MRFIKPTSVPAGDFPSGGYVGAPQSRQWLREWIENKGQWVELECGCFEDIGDRSLTVIKSFDGCTVMCERCNRFVAVVRTVQRKTPPMKYPEEPMF